MPSPLVHTLLPTALAASSRLPKKLTLAGKLKFLVLCVGLGNCPDFDLIPVLYDHKLWFQVHRWYGHNLFTFVGLAFAGNFLFKKLLPEFSPRERWLCVVGLIASHLVLDGMVWPAVPRSGVPLWWPFSHHCVHMPFQLFPSLSQHDSMPGLIGYAVAHENWKFVFGAELVMSATLWLLLTLSARVVAHFFRSTGASRPILQSSPQYTPERPSRRLPDDSPTHTYTDSGLGS